MELETKYKNIIIARGDTHSYYNLDILVDNQSYGILKARDRLELNIEENNAHRIQCVISNGTDIVKSNVLFFNIGELTNIYVQLDQQGYYKQIEISKCENLENLDALMVKATKENELKIKKEKEKKKKTLIIAGIIIVPLIICLICLGQINTSSKNDNDIANFTLSDMTWLLGEDKTFVVIGCKITNNSSKKRTYYCSYGLHRRSDDFLIAYGTALSITISPNSSKDNPAVCDPSDIWVAMGKGKRFKESDLTDTYIKIHSITIDGHRIDLKNNYILDI